MEAGWPRVLYLIAAAVLIADRLTKTLVQNSMELYESIPVLEGIFHLTYVRNPGGAFGLLAHWTPLFVIVSTGAVIGIIVYARRAKPADRFLVTGLGLQLGGAIGNLYDRLLSRTVIDFLDFRIWPVFNIADSALIIGVAVLAYTILFRMKLAD